MQLGQMDVKTAFLQGDLEDEIYMQQPDYQKDLPTKNDRILCASSVRAFMA